MRYRLNIRILAGLTIAAIALGAGIAHAQYKYVGPDGRVVYSDQPPPSNAKNVQKPATTGNASAGSSSGLPYALQQAVKTFPATLYTSKDCDACNQARNFLGKRGIPFTEKTVGNADDFKVFKDATGASQVPVLMLGNNKQVGFEEGAWNGALNVAGYPPNNLLPASYRNPAAAPAAPFTPEAKASPGAPQQSAQGSPPPAQPGAPSAPGAQPPPSGDRPPNWFKGF